MYSQLDGGRVVELPQTWTPWVQHLSWWSRKTCINRDKIINVLSRFVLYGHKSHTVCHTAAKVFLKLLIHFSFLGFVTYRINQGMLVPIASDIDQEIIPSFNYPSTGWGATSKMSIQPQKRRGTVGSWAYQVCNNGHGTFPSPPKYGLTDSQALWLWS